jgi:hypothetical protein
MSCPFDEFWSKAHVGESSRLSGVVDVVEEPFDVKKEDACLEACRVCRLYVVDECEPSI